jgi:hypothetical protein
MKVFSAGYSDTENVAQTTENVEQTPSRDNMEEQISDLVRIADLAMHVLLSEREEEITDQDSTVLQIILEDIQQRAGQDQGRA